MILSIFDYPLAIYCGYVLLFKASQIRCGKLVSLLIILLLVSDVMYPISRTFFYVAYTNNVEAYFTVSAVTGGLQQSAFSVAIWIFAIKMWALALNFNEVIN